MSSSRTQRFSRGAVVAFSLAGALCSWRARAQQADAGSSDASAPGNKLVGNVVIEETDTKTEPRPPAPVGEERRAIGEYIHEHSDGVHDCYATRLREKPLLRGTVVVHVQIGPNGRVIGATAQGVPQTGPGGRVIVEGVTDRELFACIIGEVRKWEFEKPASGGKLSVGYPFVLTPLVSQ